MNEPPVIHPRTCCKRCSTILVDGWPHVMVLSAPDRRAEVAPLCPQCADLARVWFLRPEAPNRISVASPAPR